MEIDYTKLQRDYRENPIKVGQQLIYDDVHYLYWELNLTKQQVANIMGCSSNKVYKFAKEHNLVKTQEMITNSQKNLVMDRYGVDNIMKVDSFKENLRNSLKEMYQNEDKKQEILNKTKETNQIKYGCDNVSQNEQIKKKKENTCMQRYGVKSIQQCKEIQQRTIETVQKKYGGFPFCPESKSNEKLTGTMKRLYGYENAMQNKEIAKGVGQTQKAKQEEYRQRNLQKYGVEHPGKLQEIIDKINNTKTKNNSFNVSKEEKQLKTLLESIFPNVVYNKTHKPRYPFRCDFYIPELDLFVEYHGTWTHGKLPFDENNPTCMQILQKWKEKAKTSKYYKNAIYTWTDLDVRKLKCAKENNLNWVALYSLDEFMEWYNKMIRSLFD